MVLLILGEPGYMLPSISHSAVDNSQRRGQPLSQTRDASDLCLPLACELVTVSDKR